MNKQHMRWKIYARKPIILLKEIQEQRSGKIPLLMWPSLPKQYINLMYSLSAFLYFSRK